MQLKKIGVAGCGRMGSGIAQICAESGYQTLYYDINNELLNRGLEMIKTSLGKGVERGVITGEESKVVLSRLKGTIDVRDFADCDLVIEAIIEDIEAKKELFAILDKLCKKDAIFGSNTSTLSITEMAVATNRVNKVIGIHFSNPVQVMKLMELVQTELCSNETIETIKEFGRSIGKTVILAKDAPGFIMNRLLFTLLLEAIRMYESGFASKEDIDNSLVLGCNFPQGPLSLADRIGLDVVYAGAVCLYDNFKDTKFAPPTLLKRMVVAGQLGRKTGRGFYSYKSNNQF
jgi:3-hydroxybutyryl-CoA dehydrogenase